MKNLRVFLFLISTLMVGGLIGCTTNGSATLQVEEHQLTSEPQLIPLTFQPIQGTQEEILASHSADRSKVILNEVVTIDGNPMMTSIGEKADLQAVVLTAATGQPDQTVQLKRGKEVIFEAPAGLPSPLVPIQALWTYNGHWAMEILFSDSETWAGRIYIDGKLVNEQKGYDEAFGLQMLNDKPFFFYMREGKVGYSFDGKETDLNFSDIPHYHCCAEGEINPIHAEDMVAFFAKRENNWYYVELGKFSR